MDASEFFSSLPDVLLDFFNRCLEIFVELVDSFMVPVVESLPDIEIPIQQFYRYLGLVDQFFALNYALTLFTAWVTVTLAVAVINWTLGLIPAES